MEMTTASKVVRVTITLTIDEALQIDSMLHRATKIANVTYVPEEWPPISAEWCRMVTSVT